jgi:hypothetical protein
MKDEGLAEVSKSSHKGSLHQLTYPDIMIRMHAPDERGDESLKEIDLVTK